MTEEECKRKEFYASLPDGLMKAASSGKSCVEFNESCLLEKGTNISELSSWCDDNDIPYTSYNATSGWVCLRPPAVKKQEQVR